MCGVELPPDRSALVVVTWKLVRKLLFTLLLPTAELQEESRREMGGGSMIYFYFLADWLGRWRVPRGGDVRSCKIRIVE